MAFADLSPYEEIMNCKKREEQQSNISRHSVKPSTKISKDAGTYVLLATIFFSFL